MAHVESGFTIIELLIVMAIISVLAAIAIPQFAQYKEKGHDRAAQSALRTVATAQEAYFLENDSYVTCDQTNCHLMLSGIEPLQVGISLQITSSGTEFTGIASHISGTGAVFSWPN